MNRPHARPLTLALGANALFSGGWALVLLFRPDALAPHFGEVPEAWLRIVGGLLAGFVPVLMLAWRQVSRAEPRVGVALAAVALDLGWVAGSLALLPYAVERFSTLGIALFAGVAAAVALLAALQWRGVGRLYAEPDGAWGTTHRVEVTVDADVTPEALWPVIADLGSIDRHLAGLAEARVDATPGVGAVRTCANAKGQSWSEEVTGWDPGRSLTLRFLSDRDDFPYPLDPMVGGWRLEALGADACRTTVWWSFTPRPRWLAPAMAPLLLSKVRPDMIATVQSMARVARTRDAPERASA